MIGYLIPTTCTVWVVRFSFFFFSFFFVRLPLLICLFAFATKLMQIEKYAYVQQNTRAKPKIRRRLHISSVTDQNANSMPNDLPNLDEFIWNQLAVSTEVHFLLRSASIILCFVYNFQVSLELRFVRECTVSDVRQTVSRKVGRQKMKKWKVKLSKHFAEQKIVKSSTTSVQTLEDIVISLWSCAGVQKM